MSNSDQEPTLDIAHGDQARSHNLRASLKVLRDRVDNPDFRRLVDDVLTGKASLRDVAKTDAFGAAIAPLAQQSVDRLNEMSDDEKEEHAKEGERHFDELRSKIARGEPLDGASPRSGDAPADEEEDFSQMSFLEDPSRRNR